MNSFGFIIIIAGCVVTGWNGRNGWVALGGVLIALGTSMVFGWKDVHNFAIFLCPS